MRGAFLVFLLANLMWPLPGGAQLAEGLAGRWTGIAPFDGNGEPLHLELQALGDGFDVAVELPDEPPLAASLVPTERQRVYAVATERGGMFGFFDGSASIDPLAGQPLIWARTTETGLIVYRLTIADDGGMGLVRIAVGPADDAVELAVERRVDTHPPIRWQVALERQD